VARILPDREIRPLLGKVILGASEACVRINAYEVRLGNRVRFDSTGEELEMPPGSFLEIEPGELVAIASLESLDLRRDTLKGVGKPGIVGFITPTTTMMREGFLFSSTKVDAGYHGVLNWAIRNSSIKAIRLQHGERLFKLTLFELERDEVPDRLYGESEKDYYQDTEGIKTSARMLPASIPDSKIVRRSERKIDPKKQLQEAGSPFNYIGTELVQLNGKFEVVSNTVTALKHEFSTLQNNLEQKIITETATLSGKLTELKESLSTKIKDVFKDEFDLFVGRKLFQFYGSLLATAAMLVAIYKYVIEAAPRPRQALVFLLISLGAAFLAFFIPWLLRKKA
jgi:deoxycytidine triphosphate deaminase